MSNSTDSDLSIHEITTLTDPLYDSWLNIYQKSFPLNEQMLVSEHNKSLRSGVENGARDEVYLVSLNQEKRVTGIVRANYSVEHQAIALWYLAVDPELRGGGIGAWLYHESIRYVSRGREVKALVFEVEIPDECHDEASKSVAERRIGFYRRQGAKLFGGIHYIQSVGWQPPIPMHVMIDLFVEMTPEEALDLTRATLDEKFEQVGEITLS
jgi:ribosomal protein S18 acetylase RimI-like enzyme